MDAVLNDTNTVTPALVVDFDIIRNTYHRFENAFPGAHIDYAVKANAHPLIMREVVELGGGLEIASLAELNRALEVGATGQRIICSNPI